ncbi:hypothetical protein CLU79DRAFT_890256 [Phycomyces nitens]|nr:hypothetical protein CLU79DRAFT_890256 [Phycomyces nitens]
MDILKSYVQEMGDKVEIKLSQFVTKKQDLIIRHATNVLNDQQVNAKQLNTYWSRMFSSLKRKEVKLKFVSDSGAIDWDAIVDRVLEGKLAALSRKRRNLHINLHLQEDASVTDTIIAKSAVKPRDEIDRLFMEADNEPVPPNINLIVQTWIDKAQYVQELHKQDKNLCSEGENELLDENMNENEFTMCFMYPILNNLFKYSKKDMIIRWGEAKLASKKKEEHAALEDNFRRSPGPSIDFIFRTKQEKIEIAIGEISGAPNTLSQEHYLGDRNKIAKNMKSMLKYIINLKSELNENDASKIQIYGIHLYQFKIIVYRLMYHRGTYVFLQVDSFTIPVIPLTFEDQLPIFISHMWKLKNYLNESHKSVTGYLKASSRAQTTRCSLSPPYVSPQKRQKIKNIFF